MTSLFKNYIHHIRTLVASAGPRGRIVFLSLAGLLVIGALGIVWTLNTHFSIQVPASGGSISLGVVGTPRFINPVLATSDVDRDLTTLVYSGLMRRGSDGVSFVPDLAESYTLSDDQLTYTFVIKSNARFHNGKPVTADDIAFTIEKIQDSTLKSPWRIQWTDIAVTAVDERTISFKLGKPYAGFLLATTVGVLPKNVWDGMTAQEFEFSKYNARPVGSGSYRLAGVRAQKDGTATAYKLIRFKRFALGKPYITDITFKFYPNEGELLSAFENKEIANIHAFPPEYAAAIRRRDVTIREVPLPRVFAMFFNQSKNRIFLEKPVVEAVSLALDREAIIRSALQGFGTAIDGPLPPTLPATAGASSAPANIVPAQNIARASELLEKAGWKWNPATSVREKVEKSTVTQLAFTLATADTPDLEATAHEIKEHLAEVGIKVEIRLFGLGNLDRDVIRPREYEALLFGQVLRYDTDLYAFWHSSQRNDPGLNVALYANQTVDRALEEALATGDTTKRLALYEKVSQALRADAPAVFLYAPHLLLAFDRDIAGNELLEVAQPGNRLLFAHEWFVRKDRVWKFWAGN